MKSVASVAVEAVGKVARMSVSVAGSQSNCENMNFTSLRSNLLDLSIIGVRIPQYLHTQPQMRPPFFPQTTGGRLDISEDLDCAKLSDVVALEHALYGRCSDSEIGKARGSNWCCLIDMSEEEKNYVRYSMTAAEETNILTSCVKARMDSVATFNRGDLCPEITAEWIRTKMAQLEPTVSSLISYVDSHILRTHTSDVQNFSTNTHGKRLRMTDDSVRTGTTNDEGNSVSREDTQGLLFKLQGEEFRSQKNIFLRDLLLSRLATRDHRASLPTTPLNTFLSRQGTVDAFHNGFIAWHGNVPEKRERVNDGAFGQVLEADEDCAKLCVLEVSVRNGKAGQREKKAYTIPDFVTRYGVAVQEAQHEAMVGLRLRSYFKGRESSMNVVPIQAITIPIGSLMPRALIDAQELAHHVRSARAASAILTAVCEHMFEFGVGQDCVYDGVSLCGSTASVFRGEGVGTPGECLGWKDCDKIKSAVARGSHSVGESLSMLSCSWDCSSLEETMCALGLWLRRRLSESGIGSTWSCTDIESKRMSTLLSFLSQYLGAIGSLKSAGMIQCDCTLSNALIFSCGERRTGATTDEASVVYGDPAVDWMRLMMCDLGAVRRMGVRQIKRGPNFSVELGMRPDLTTEMRRATPSAISPEHIRAWVDDSEFVASEKTAVNAFGAIAEDMLRCCYGSGNVSAVLRRFPSLRVDSDVFSLKMGTVVTESSRTALDFDYPLLRMSNWRHIVRRMRGSESKASLECVKQTTSYFSRLQKLGRSPLPSYPDENEGDILKRKLLDGRFTASLIDGEPGNISALHVLIKGLPGQVKVHTFLYELGRFLQSSAMMGTGFGSGVDSNVKLKQRAVEYIATKHAFQNENVHRLICLMEMSFGGIFGVDECALVGLEMIRLSQKLKLHCEVLVSVVELLSKCGQLGEDSRPSIAECASTIKELKNKTSVR